MDLEERGSGSQRQDRLGRRLAEVGRIGHQDMVAILRQAGAAGEAVRGRATLLQRRISSRDLSRCRRQNGRSLQADADRRARHILTRKSPSSPAVVRRPVPMRKRPSLARNPSNMARTSSAGRTALHKSRGRSRHNRTCPIDAGGTVTASFTGVRSGTGSAGLDDAGEIPRSGRGPVWPASRTGALPGESRSRVSIAFRKKSEWPHRRLTRASLRPARAGLAGR